MMFALRVMILGAALVVTSGCGGPHDAAVNGRVKLDGVALPRGSVTFYPVAGGPTAYARIEEDGRYVVHTGREEGLPSGEYQVTVAANEPAPQAATSGPPPVGKPIAPLWYRSKGTSYLQFMVNPGNNHIDLELSSTPPP